MNKIYAGIGSRGTPTDICATMTQLASNLANVGWSLRSGHALGADYGFECGADKGEIHLPWQRYNRELPWVTGLTYFVPEDNDATNALAKQFHPVWDSLSQGAQKLMARNVTIMLGLNLDTPVDMVICWTRHGLPIGGTGQALRMAHHYGIPTFNLAINEDWHKLEEFAQSSS